ncbi:hypothetical protein [Pleionea sp. CnH1-48]|uniref:hypothetical protein n=1 Tax=Pleionea sp. CnH1-48 TaxID=2954494 RepID=UPI002097ADB9|nr:hypothetical protein [Pleionea sp. CnH1-48]MCO7225913.1 hypothetical protein [Pleionea sp. CnH1-48]
MNFIHCAIPKVSDVKLPAYQIIIEAENDDYIYGTNPETDGLIKLPKEDFRVLPARTQEVA